jgi:hypothetical protein
MPSTYTTNGGIEKVATGEQSGTWGDTTNLNFDIIDRITNGVGTITLSGTSSNLQTSDGVLSDGQYKAVVLAGSPSGTHTITVLPNDAQKIYFVSNTTSQSVIFDQGSGSNVTILANTSDIIYCNGGGSSGAVVSLIDDVDLTGYMQSSNNLSDVSSTSTALQNLGITSTAAELNILDGVTSTAAELNYNDITTLGTSQASKVVTADANGDVKFSNAVVETVYALTGTALDPNNGTTQTKTISANTTFTDSLSSGESMSLHLTGASSYTITWPTITWVSRAGNYAPTLTAADTVVLFKISTALYGVWIGSSA